MNATLESHKVQESNFLARLDLAKKDYMTVCFFINCHAFPKPHVFLGIKGRKIGKGCRNSYGGRIEANETPRECTKREVYVESGGVSTDTADFKYVACGEFTTENADKSLVVRDVKIFVSEKWHGNFTSTPEMWDGRWYPVDKLPLAELMPADRQWLRIVLENNIGDEHKCYLIEALYGPNQQSLLKEVVITPVRRMTVA